MNRIFKISTVFLAGALLMASCQEEKYFQKAEKGPEVTVKAYTENAYMGGMVKFAVELKDASYDLSVLNAKLMYDESEVSKVTLRTKTEGVYEGEILAPLYANSVNSGVASLVLEAVNVGLGKTEETVAVALERPNFENLTLSDQDGNKWTMNRVADYLYEVTDNFPALLQATVTSPAINEDGDVIVIGWDSSASKLDVTKDTPIPFSASLAGEYTVSVNLQTLEASPFGYVIEEELDLSEAEPEKMYDLRQNLALVFPEIDAVSDWDLDPDFFTVDENKNVIFKAMDGRYKFIADFTQSFVKVLPVDADGNTLTLDENGDGAVWAIGQNFGKPVIGPSWNTTDGAYALAQVSPKVYQFTLNAGGQLKEGVAIKFFHQMGWGGEITGADYASVDGAGVFVVTESGDINIGEGKKPADKKAYRFTLDLTGGRSAAKLKIKEVEAVGGAALDISVNGAKADRLSKNIYKVKTVSLKKGDAVSFSGIEDPDSWYIDPDHFTGTAAGALFNAVDGYYSIEMNLESKFMTVRRVKADGSAATFKDEGAITVMAWGLAHPVMTSQLAWDSGALITMAEIEKGVYQFSGIAVEEEDGTTMGGRFRYDYLSVKFFGQAGWGDEMGTATLTDAAKTVLAVPGNIELAEGVELEKGATYVMTVRADNSGFAGGKFDVEVDFQKK